MTPGSVFTNCSSQQELSRVSDPVSAAGTHTALASKLVAVTGSGLAGRAEVQRLAWPGLWVKRLVTHFLGYPGP